MWVDLTEFCACLNVICAGHGADVHVAIFGDKKLLPGVMTLATSIVNNTHSDVMFHFVTLPGDAEIFRCAVMSDELPVLLLLSLDLLLGDVLTWIVPQASQHCKPAEENVAAGVHTYKQHTYKYTYIHVHIHTCICTYMLACIPIGT